MALELGLIPKPQARLATALDLGLSSKTGLVELETYYRLYLFDCGCSGKSPVTLDNYTRRVGDFVRFIKSNNLPTDLARITAHEIRLYLYWLQERNFAKTTAHTHYRALKTFFNWLVAQEYLKQNPVLSVKLAKPQDPPVKPFDQEDIRRFLLLCSGSRYLDVRNRALVLAFYDSGLRLSEMASLTMNSVDWNTGTIEVKGKGGRYRLVKVGKAALRAMVHYHLMRGSESPALWLSEERWPLTRDGIEETIQKLAKRAGITRAKRGPHTFRHSFGTQLLDNGADPFHVQTLLGHASQNMTRRYVQTIAPRKALQAHETFSPVDNLFHK